MAIVRGPSPMPDDASATTHRPLPRVVSVGLPSLALALIVAGLAIEIEQASTASFGWYAYAPLSHTVFAPAIRPAVWTARGLIVLGLVVAGFWAGLLVGRRPGAR